MSRKMNNNTHTFSVTGMHCAGCAAAVERAVKKLPGVTDIYVNFATGKLNLSSTNDYPGDEVVIETVQKAGFKAALAETASAPGTEPDNSDSQNDRIELCRFAICAFFNFIREY